MADKSDLLLAIYQDRNTYARHYDELQTKVTNILIVVAAGILAFTANNGLTKDKWPLAVFLFIIGIFGVLVTFKLNERTLYFLISARE